MPTKTGSVASAERPSSRTPLTAEAEQADGEAEGADEEHQRDCRDELGLGQPQRGEKDH